MQPFYIFSVKNENKHFPEVAPRKVCSRNTT